MRIKALVGSVVVAATSIVAGPLGTAQAEAGPVVVHGLSFPLGSPVQLSFVGCRSLYSRASETVTPRISTDADLGDRSVAYDLSGGNAIGTLAYVDSVARTRSVGLRVKADQGTTGVAYAVYQTAQQRGTTKLWVGRAPLSAGASGWHDVDAVGARYTWSQVDSRTGRALTAPAAATVAAFTKAYGDGAGFFTVGFGCDGKPFQVDGLSLNGTVDDLEGLDAQVGIGSSTGFLVPGGHVTLSGSLSDGLGGHIPQGTLILEARTADSDWSPVAVLDASDGSAQVSLAPTETTTYRFVFGERDIAPASQSGEVTVQVRTRPSNAPSTKPSPTSTPSSPAPSSPASNTPATSSPATSSPASSSKAPSNSADAPAKTSDAPAKTSDAPAKTSDAPAKTSDAPSRTPSQQPSEKPAPSPTGTASPSPSEEPTRTAGGG